MGATLHERVTERWAAAADALALSHGTLALDVAPALLLEIAGSLKAEFGFDQLSDLTAVDWPKREPRFDVVYHFYSMREHQRVRVKTYAPAAAPQVDSLITLYNSARFAERECHEMYGIVFRGNDDLRPILMYEGFVGFPLRKDYPKHREQPLVPYIK
jgi:NADH-quinone oxidoreductase subunit C